MSLVGVLAGLFRYYQVRRYARRNGMDFRLASVTDLELGRFGWPHHGSVVELRMRCYRLARYRAEITHIYDGGHGHKDWKFTFLGYVN